MLALVILHMYLYGWNIFIWRRVRINYAFIFEFTPGSELRYREVLLVCTALTALLIGAMVIHLTIHSTLVQGQASAYIDLIPFAVMLVSVSTAVLYNLSLIYSLNPFCSCHCIAVCSFYSKPGECVRMQIFLVLLFNPLDVCYRSSRFFFLSALLHIVCAPLYKVLILNLRLL